MIRRSGTACGRHGGRNEGEQRVGVLMSNTEGGLQDFTKLTRNILYCLCTSAAPEPPCLHPPALCMNVKMLSGILYRLNETRAEPT